MKKFVRKLEASEGEDADLEELRGQSPEEKLSIHQELRDEHYRFTNEDRKGFQRVWRIVERKVSADWRGCFVTLPMAG